MKTCISTINLFGTLIGLLAFTFISSNISGQRLVNRSFEGVPQDAVMPMGWFSCREGTTPDIQPGPWGVFQRASQGKTYLGLITRPDGSWESIGQRFSSPLVAGTCYKLSIDIAHSPTYADYNQATCVRIWLGKTKGSREMLIRETEAILHIDWQTYSWKFTADQPYEYLIIEAWFAETGVWSSGNVLLDNLRPIRKCTGV